MANRKDFYIGRKYDPGTKSLTTESIQYDPADLTTHMFVTGMTGSGKTGLCISIMEEAALQRIPAIIIDPKGDLTNLILHFPQFLSSDFEPWIDPEAAKREGKSTTQMAEETAANWKKGLSDWGIAPDELEELSHAVNFSIYTPGSTSGLPINILSSFAAPEIPWEENQENLRERISSNITALLGLIGFSDIDPLSSREHILLANIMEHFWSQGINFDMTDLILQTQSPPFERLGAFPVEKLFPEKDRLVLAMRLNNFLASPSFQTWLQGQSLDIQQIYFTPDGKPRHSIFYLAHLSENERMFFVTLLYGAVESWMRRQTGTSGLRALVYFDEILGFLPPIGNPPSHSVMLRMLKQARAFGVGLILSSQNPVDLDYKALSNAGTWMIGRLQTDQDKERLMDGLQNASGSVDRSVANQLLSSLGKRIFLYHNIHEKGLALFGTRWAMNYLAGPLTRNQIPALNKLAGVSTENKPMTTSQPAQETIQSQSVTSVSATAAVSSAIKKPILPSGVDEFYLPTNLTLENAARNQQIQLSTDAKVERIEYHPTLISQAEVRYLDRRYSLQMSIKKATIVEDETGRMIRWDDFISSPIENKDLGQSALPQTNFRDLPMWLSDTRNLKSLQTDFMDWIYRSASIKVQANQTLKIFAGPETSSTEFQKMCSDAANELMDAELEKVKAVYEKKMDVLEDKLEKEMRDVDSAENTLEKRRMEEVGTHGELLLSFLTKRKKSISSSLSKRRMTSEAKSNLSEQKLEVEIAQKNLDKMEEEMKAKIAEIESLYSEKVNDVTEIPVTPMKKDIFLETYGIGWLPYYRVKSGDRTYEIPAYKA
ncbi:MAG: ATP-binding protein [Anaerolineaceae bacterium]